VRASFVPAGRFCCLLTLFVLAFVQNAFSEEKPEPVRIAIIGDSTAASYPNPPKDRPDLTGWGQVFGEFFNDQVVILNHAKSGRSSRSFVREGLWEKTLADQPDFVFIQFGHNDTSKKHDRFTDPSSTFQDYMRAYVKEAQAAGVKPIIVSPMTRRVFKDGKIHTTLRPYAEAALKVAKEEAIPAIDLHARSVVMFNVLGDAGSADYSPSQPDRTHFSSKGARAIAKLVVEGIQDTVPELQGYLKTEKPQ